MSPRRHKLRFTQFPAAGCALCRKLRFASLFLLSDADPRYALGSSSVETGIAWGRGKCERLGSASF